jgi:hypothetical protein
MVEPTQRWLGPTLLRALLLCAARSSESCVNDEAGLEALDLGMTCADVARLSQGLVVLGHRLGLCGILKNYGLLGLCCEACSAIDECTSYPCSNGGTCSDGTAAYSCACTVGWAGDHCQTEWVIPDVCPNTTFVQGQPPNGWNSSIVCELPHCYAINGGAERCTTCTVCGAGFTHIAECVQGTRAGANGTDGADTVCERESACSECCARDGAVTLSPDRVHGATWQLHRVNLSPTWLCSRTPPLLARSTRLSPTPSSAPSSAMKVGRRLMGNPRRATPVRLTAHGLCRRTWSAMVGRPSPMQLTGAASVYAYIASPCI